MFLRNDDRLTLPIYEGGRRREEKRKERKGEEERATEVERAEYKQHFGS